MTDGLSKPLLDMTSPWRLKQDRSSKIIFLALEGRVTEEEYFNIVQNVYIDVKHKIQFISVNETILSKPKESLTSDDKRALSSTSVRQLIDKVKAFKERENKRFDLDSHKDDEFWLVFDVDKRWDTQNDLRKYQNDITECENLGFHYAVSNPFFEVWLLLHHDNPTDKDKSFAVVTDTNKYRKVPHFRRRLRDCGAPLFRKKHINQLDYNDSNIRLAASRAKNLHRDPADLSPQYLATTVYLLLEKVFEMITKNGSAGSLNTP